MMFDHRIDDLLKENNITVAFLDDLDSKGLYIPEKKTIILKSELSKEEQILVLLHELGHILHDDDVPGSYVDYRVPHSKMEHQANIFMLRELLHQYILTNNADPEDINCVAFLESEKLPLSLEDSVKQILSDGVTA
ncbi:ImmA/IrrE family metallo-endopeptidase [Ligilactobacillus saerimneri]|uniref:ImmA/IrrE family metallo-endopeptidase n=1 Tax=Ligilactobacillus saerimneri TaxID=228229 RepID=A0A7H9EKQ2_9LACO|nr:ImmA/IrrE family metallo-endopeptidase [Ligilactobacillus saerimneri]QLL77745.1 ImmA/IrrE family metallo-endopeptidase [Ligilactobacillus saerimneri]